MKRILLFIGLIVSMFASAQLPTIPGFTKINQKYIWQGMLPPNDTSYSKYGWAYIDSIPYWGDGLRWHKSIQLRLTNPLPGDQLFLYTDSSTVVNGAITPKTGLNGTVSLIDNGNLSYTVLYPQGYFIGGQYIPPGSGTITLPVGTAGIDSGRIDLITLNAAGAGSIQGENSDNPKEPVYDQQTTIRISSVIILSDDTVAAPQNTSTNNLVYNENAGSPGEATYSTTGTITSNADANTSGQAYNGTKYISITAFANTARMDFTFAAALDKSAYTNIYGYIKINTAWNAATNYSVSLVNGTTATNAIQLTTYGIIKTTTGIYQPFSIPLSVFTGSPQFTGIRITRAGTTGTVNWQLDYLQLQASGVTVTTTTTTNTFTQGVRTVGSVVSIDNNRDITYIQQPSTGNALDPNWTAVGNPTYTVANGSFVFSGNGNNYTKYIRANAGVMAEGSSVEADVHVTTVGSTDQGPQIGWVSYNSNSYTHSVYGGFVTGASATGGNKSVMFGTSASYYAYSDSVKTVSNGDDLHYVLTNNALSYTIQVTNITKGWKLQKTVQTYPDGTPFVSHNSAYVAVFPGAGSYTVSNLKYVIHAPIETDMMIIGNSITYGQGSGSENARWAANIGDRSKNIISGGGADITAEVLGRLQEIKAIHPKRVLLMIGGNDILFGVSSATWKANYKRIRDSIVSYGIQVVHLLPSPRTTTDVSALKTEIETNLTYSSDVIVRGTWYDLLGSGTSLKSIYNLDGTHPNQAGHSAIAAAINDELHLTNSKRTIINGSVYARNGFLSGTDAGTGVDQYLAGGLIAFQQNDTNSYVQMGMIGDNAYITALKKDVGYRNILISAAGQAKVSIGGETSPQGTLDIKNIGSGSQTILTLNKGSGYTNNDEEVRFDFDNAHVINGRIANFVHNTDKLGFRFYGSSSNTLNTTPSFEVRGDLSAKVYGKFKVGDIPVTSDSDSALVYNRSDSTFYLAKINGAGGGGGSGTVNSGAANRLAYYASLGTTVDDLAAITANRALISDANGLPTHSSVTNTELGYLSGVTSSIQTQINAVSGIQNQFASAQTARAWTTGIIRSDSSFQGRTTGATGGFKTGGVLAFAATGTSSYAQMGYDATLNAGWVQAVTEGSAYRDFIFNPAGGNLGFGTLSSAPSVTLHLYKTVYPAIRFEKQGTGSWYIGNRPESSATDFMISQNSTDYVSINTSGQIALGSTTHTSTVDVNGSFSTAYVAKSSSYTATISDNVIEVTATGQTITLPTAVGITGREYTVKLTASGTGTVGTTSSQTIDGSTTYSLSAQYKYVTVKSNGANWIIIANN